MGDVNQTQLLETVNTNNATSDANTASNGIATANSTTKRNNNNNNNNKNNNNRNQHHNYQRHQRYPRQDHFRNHNNFNNNNDNYSYCENSNFNGMNTNNRRFFHNNNSYRSSNNYYDDRNYLYHDVYHNNYEHTNNNNHNNNNHNNNNNNNNYNQNLNHRSNRNNNKYSKNNHSNNGMNQNANSPSPSNSSNTKTKNSHNNQTKNKLEDRREILIDQLKKNKYECVVCCQVIRAEKPIWHCNQSCFHIFHLTCIKKWAQSPVAKIDESNPNKWRCPYCQFVYDSIPKKYSCFCGKKMNPDNHQLNKHQLVHTCGEVCSKPLLQSRKYWLKEESTNLEIYLNEDEMGCKHTCTQLCHPGPCPTCETIVTRQCNCGKSKFQVKCNSNKKPVCNVKCEKYLNCGKHKCDQICHSGECDPCQIELEQYCYSHNEKRVIKCNGTDNEIKYFKCNKKCLKKLSCGNHECQEECHEGECKPCELLPSKLLTCPCGKTQMKELLIKNKIIRTNCLSPVPCCEKKCEKILSCLGDNNGNVHFCESQCHTGECPPCTKMIEKKCRCSKESQIIECHKSDDIIFCNRRCSKKKSCGRHQCNEMCCNDLDHICMMICNRVLNCGLHNCEELCHKGLCKRCLVASFEERICDCGSTIQYPPIRCGTKPLECNQKCSREHSCDHPVTHNCHWEEKCPPCSFLTSKMCMGGHELRHNIPCYMKDVSCGKPCGNNLKNCSHKCIKTCHKMSEECLNENENCVQPCQKERPHCDHVCNQPCHGNTSKCPDTVCQALVTVKCRCGLKSKQIKCGQRMYESSQVVFENLASELKEMLSCKSIDISSFNDHDTQKKKHELICDEECFMHERNMSLAQALQIDPTKPKPIYSDYLKNYAREEPNFVIELEKKFDAIVKEVKSPLNKLTKKNYNFPVMKAHERKFIHELATYYGFETQSHDQEPFRNVCVYASKDKCYIPSILLSHASQINLKQSAISRLNNINKLNQASSNIQSNMKTLIKVNNQQDLPLSSMYSVLTDQENDDTNELIVKQTQATVAKINETDNKKVIDYFDMTD